VAEWSIAPVGSVAEWSIAPVLKTGNGQPFVSSNLTASASCTQSVTQGFNCSGSEMGHLFYADLGGSAGSDKRGTQSVGDVTFFNIQANYISGTRVVGANAAGDFLFLNGWQSDTLLSFPNFAWAIRDGDVSQLAPIPEPETYAMMLAGLGLLGLVAQGRKAKL
jgi:hypothetical protein